MTVDAGPKRKKREPARHSHARAFLMANGIEAREICWVFPDAIWYTTKIDGEPRTAWLRPEGGKLKATPEGKSPKPAVQEIAFEHGFPTWPRAGLAWRRVVKVA